MQFETCHSHHAISAKKREKSVVFIPGNSGFSFSFSFFSPPTILFFLFGFYLV